MAAVSVAVPRSRRPAYSRLARPAATDSAYSCPSSALARSTTSNPGEGVAPGATIGMRRCERVCGPRSTTTPPASVPSATSRLTVASSGTQPHHDVARELAGVHGGPQRAPARLPTRRSGSAAVEAFPGEGEAEDGGDGERRHQAGDHGGAVAHPPAQFVEGDDEGGQPPCP